MSRSLRPALALVLASLVLAPEVAAQEGFNLRRSSDRVFDQRVRRADPGKVVATELAFARAAQEKGQWTAFAEFAADEAVMFVPEPVNAKEWLRRQRNPAQAVRWQPHQVWSSCDGTLAVTKGAWQRPDGSTGYFTTVWQRQRNGEFKWVMDQGDALEQALEAPEMVGSKVADCRPLSPNATPPSLAMDSLAKVNQGQSRDGTLRWHVVTDPSGSRHVGASYWDGTTWQTALEEKVAAP